MLTRNDEAAQIRKRVPGTLRAVAFEVIPAVDLLGDEVVRLEQGRFDRVVARRGDPGVLVRSLAEAGARRLHLVDLDGARTGKVRVELVRELCAAAAPARVQAAGGVRAPADASALLEAGADRVVVGTAAFADPGALAAYRDALGDRLVVAVDVRHERLTTGGWLVDAGLGLDEALERCAEAGVPRLQCTAVERDGTLSGPDLDLLAGIVERSGVPVLAAGGIRSPDDLDALARLGCEGAIVGRALLDGRLPRSVLARAGGPPAAS